MDKILEAGLGHHKNNNFNEAEKIYLTVLESNKNSFEANQLLGALYLQIGKLDKAEKFLITANNIQSKNINVTNNLVLLYKKKKKFDLAIDFYKKNIVNQNSIQFQLGLSSIYFEANQFEKSLEILLQIKKENHTNTDLDVKIALNYYKKNSIQKSLQILKNLHDSKKLTLDGYLNYGKILYDLKKFSEAKEFFNVYLSKNPNHFECLMLRSQINKILNRPDEAFIDFSNLLKIQPNNYFLNKDFILFLINTNNYQAAIEHCKRLLNGKIVERNYFLLVFQYLKLLVADWDNFDSHLGECTKLLKNDQNSYDFSPLNVKYFLDDPEIDMKVAKLVTNRIFETINFSEIKKSKEVNQKFRVGFVSGDFKNHAVSYLIKDYFKYYDKNKFEIFLYSNCSDNSEITEELKKLIPNFFEIYNLSDYNSYELILSHNLDIVYDLSGHTKFNRISLFQYNIAKYKINFLGYPGTMGNNAYDYIIADKNIINEKNKKFFSEKILYHPDVYQPFSKYDFIKKNRSFFGYDDEDFLLIAPHRVEKITPKIFEVWTNLLLESNLTKLLLGPTNDIAKKNLFEFAKKKGVDKKIFFLDKTKRTEYLQKINICDLFLDTYPYNGHTTTAESLFICNTPIITLSGSSFASRVSGSILKSLGLKELVADNLNDYQKKIINLINNPDLIQGYKKILKKVDVDKRIKDFSKNFDNLMLGILK